MGSYIGRLDLLSRSPQQASASRPLCSSFLFTFDISEVGIFIFYPVIQKKKKLGKDAKKRGKKGNAKVKVEQESPTKKVKKEGEEQTKWKW